MQMAAAWGRLSRPLPAARHAELSSSGSGPAPARGLGTAAPHHKGGCRACWGGRRLASASRASTLTSCPLAAGAGSSPMASAGLPAGPHLVSASDHPPGGSPGSRGSSEELLGPVLGTPMTPGAGQHDRGPAGAARLGEEARRPGQLAETGPWCVRGHGGPRGDSPSPRGPHGSLHTRLCTGCPGPRTHPAHPQRSRGHGDWGLPRKQTAEAPPLLPAQVLPATAPPPEGQLLPQARRLPATAPPSPARLKPRHSGRGPSDSGGCPSRAC